MEIKISYVQSVASISLLNIIFINIQLVSMLELNTSVTSVGMYPGTRYNTFLYNEYRPYSHLQFFNTLYQFYRCFLFM